MKSWPTATTDLGDLLLDQENSRLMSLEKLTQGELRERLVEYEGVIELARSIVRNGGLHQHEFIIVVRAGAKYRVLEGNRRTCACQILCDPDLLPPNLRGRVPRASPELIKSLSRLEIKIAPSAPEAAPLIAQLHTQSGKRPWSAVAKAFHIGRMSEAGIAPKAIASELHMGVGAVKKAILSYNLLEIAKKMKPLSKTERALLHRPRLTVNPFTRFFTLKETAQLFRFGVDDAGDLSYDSSLTKNDAVSVIQAAARVFLLPQSPGGEPRFNTRAEATTVLGHLRATDATVRRLVDARHVTLNIPPPAPVPPPTKPTPTQPINLKFFRRMHPYNVTEPTLVQLISEAAQIPHAKYPTCAIYLMRALVEATLIYAIQQKQLIGDFYAKHPKHAYGLRDLLQFAIDRKADLWRDPNGVDKLINHWRSHFKYISDQTVHAAVQGNALTAEQGAGVIRPLIDGVLRGDWLKP